MRKHGTEMFCLLLQSMEETLFNFWLSVNCWCIKLGGSLLLVHKFLGSIKKKILFSWLKIQVQWHLS